jgi:Gly-Xaa carboxypeptidase
MTCAASYAEEMPSKLRSSVVKTLKGDKKAWKTLPQEIINTGIKGSATGAGQGE